MSLPALTMPKEEDEEKEASLPKVSQEGENFPEAPSRKGSHDFPKPITCQRDSGTVMTDILEGRMDLGVTVRDTSEKSTAATPQ